MNRRAFLASLAAGTTGLAGCTGGAIEPGGTDTPTPTPVEGPTLVEQGNLPDICHRVFADVGIYAIDQPAFADDWSDVEIPEGYTGEVHLVDDDVVIGLKDDESARAYPVAVLWSHEIVNDTFGPPVIVTFCSICRSGMVASRVVRGEETTFGVSGQLWEPPELESRAREQREEVFAIEPGNADPGQIRNSGNLVMFDRATWSYWSQILAQAICGPSTGETLEIVPSTATTWGEWREEHPETDVLLPPPHSTLMSLPG